MPARYLPGAVFFLLMSQALTLSIPMISTRGSHYQVGYDVGKTFSRQIREYFHLNGDLFPYFVPWSKTNIGQQIVEHYLEVANASYPQYIREMTGLADGAQLDFSQVLLMNLRSELSAIVRPDATNQAESCTDIHMNHPESGCVAFCHNEDADPAVDGRGYMVRAVIDADPELGTPAEHFTAFCYPGELPGNAFAFNQAGLTFSVNALYPKLVLDNKTPRSMLTRAMITAQSVEQAVAIITDKGVGAAYAFNGNIGTVNGSTPSIVSIESAPVRDDNKTMTDTWRVLPASNSVKDTGNYYHVNLFRHISMAERASHTVSSVHRTNRINQLKPPTSIEEALSILGDTKDANYPIYRAGTADDNSHTVATGVFDLLAGRMLVYKGNPGTSPGPIYDLPIKH